MALRGALSSKARIERFVGRVLAWLRRNAYLALMAGALLVLVRAIDFSPPDEVRIEADQAVRLVGDAPEQGFSSALGNAQAVQLRATLRLFPDETVPLSGPDPEIDAVAQLLSQPVVTTIHGIEANIEQTVRLEGGDLEINVSLVATPREYGRKRRGRRALSLERELVVKSRRRTWWNRAYKKRVHVDVRSKLMEVEGDIHRVVFTVDEYLFALDLELYRARG